MTVKPTLVVYEHSRRDDLEDIEVVDGMMEYLDGEDAAELAADLEFARSLRAELRSAGEGPRGRSD